eukprot:scaffold2188_cov388-Prasinococcus_capsulatus_cf.AAC.14
MAPPGATCGLLVGFDVAPHSSIGWWTPITRPRLLRLRADSVSSGLCSVSCGGNSPQVPDNEASMSRAIWDTRESGDGDDKVRRPSGPGTHWNFSSSYYCYSTVHTEAFAGS